MGGNLVINLLFFISGGIDFEEIKRKRRRRRKKLCVLDCLGKFKEIRLIYLYF